MEFKDRSLIITDFETTGLDPVSHDIIEVGALRVNQHTLEIEGRLFGFVRMQNPETATKEAIEINGYNEELWNKHGISLKAAMECFSHFAADGVLVAWNITFEYGFYKEALKRTGIKDTMDYHRIDLPTLAWFLYPNQRMGLDHISKYLEIPEEAKPHRAINGAEQALKVLRKMKENYGK